MYPLYPQHGHLSKLFRTHGVYSGYMATPVRHVRISDELWQAAKDKAWVQRTTVGAAINAWLTEWVAEPAPLPEGTPVERKAPR
jgi:hypothetical protein